MHITFCWLHMREPGKQSARSLAAKFNEDEKNKRWKGWSWTDRQAHKKGRLNAFQSTQETLQVEVRTLRGTQTRSLKAYIERLVGTNVEIRIDGMLPLNYAEWLEYHFNKLKKQKSA